jgi:hypothetical protein
MERPDGIRVVNALPAMRCGPSSTPRVPEDCVPEGYRVAAVSRSGEGETGAIGAAWCVDVDRE